MATNPSLEMTFELLADGTWTVEARWLDELVAAPSYQEAYWLAIAARGGDKAAE